MTQPLDLAAAFVCVGALLASAEPEIDPKDLPRIPPTEPDKALATFRIRPGFRIELVAAEPLVVDPIAMSFDEDGRLYVVEMRDYSERRPERLGRIRRLEDTNGDGRFDKSTVYVADLPWPTAVISYGGGVFVGATPDILYCKDTDGNGIADVREVVFTGFANDYAPYQTNRLNVQALLNSFNWSLDNRIHGASGGNGGKVHLVDSPFTRAWRQRISLSPASGIKPGQSLDLRGKDFSFDPRTLDLRAESGGAQYGLSFDSRGRKFVCSNSDHIQQVMYEDRYTGRNEWFSLPPPRVSIAADGPAAPVYRLSPDEPWRVIRTRWRVAGLAQGPIEGGGRPSGYFTGASGVTIYRGDALGEEFVDNAFIADCGSNLVHRKKLRPGPDGITLIAERPADEQKSEFLASTDNWFRPVQFANAPDGTLYVADMYREIIEHPWSLPPNIKKHLDLNSGSDRGRIYRIVPEGFKQRPPPRFSKARAPQLVKLLDHANGWHRETAARLIVEKQDRNVVSSLREMVKLGKKPEGRLHALYALNSLSELAEEDLIQALGDKNSILRQHAVRLSETLSGKASRRPLLAEANNPDPNVRLQLAFSIGMLPSDARAEALSRILSHSEPEFSQSSWIRAAAITSVGDEPYAMFERMIEANPSFEKERVDFAYDLAQLIGARNRSNEVLRVVDLAAEKGRILGDWFNGQDVTVAVHMALALGEGLRQAGTSLAEAAPPGRLDHVFSIARWFIADVNRDERRLAGIRLLGHDRQHEESAERLFALVTEPAKSGERQPAAIQRAAVEALLQLRSSNVVNELIQRWPKLAPPLHSTIIQTLLARAEGVALMVGALERGTIQRGDLSASQVQLLISYRDRWLRERAEKILGGSARTSGSDLIVKYESALNLKSDPTRGKEIFLNRCASCHQLAGDGHVLGPDLASVRSNGKEKLLVSILDPNREVAPQFTGYVLETNDGDSYTGILLNQSEASVTLRQAGGTEATVPRARVASLTSQGQSIMPEGLEAGLTPQDLADLIEFVMTAGATTK